MTTSGNGVTNGTLAGNREAMDRFLEKLKASGNIRLSCMAAGVSRTTVYRWRDKWSTFAAEWDEALEEAVDILEGTAWKRAVEGTSDRLLMFLLKAHRRDRFGDQVRQEIGGVGGGPIETKDVSEFTEDERIARVVAILDTARKRRDSQAN